MANLADVETQLGRYDEAAGLLDTAAQVLDRMDDPFLTAFVRINTGENELRRQRPAAALPHFQWARDYADRTHTERFYALASLGLGEALCQLGGAERAKGLRLLRESRDVARRTGDALVLDKAEQARAAQSRRTQPGPDRVGPLTRRQTEVLRLVAEGLTDKQVAERLVLSERTVNQHLTAIRKAFGVHTRGPAVARARQEYGLQY